MSKKKGIGTILSKGGQITPVWSLILSDLECSKQREEGTDF